MTEVYRKRLIKPQGFSLIEMSVVLAIMSIVVGSGISIALVQMENSRVSVTKTKQQTIKSSMLNYLVRYSRMPCPAVATLAESNSRYGVEANNPGVCTGTVGFGGGTTRNVRGIVPWISLGLAEDVASDGYGRRFTYQVLRTETATNASPGLQGNISLLNGAGTTINPQHPAIAIIISHGNNGRGAYLPGTGRRMTNPATTDEAENTDNDFIFVQKEYSNVESNPFDDIVLWLEPNALITTLSLQGSVQAPNSILRERITGIKNTFLGIITADDADPDGGGARTLGRRLPFADSKGIPDGNANGANNGFVAWLTVGLAEDDVKDPWGNYIRYTVNALLTAPGIAQSAPNVGANYRLISDGPDGVQNNADDQVFTVSENSLRGILASASVQLDP